MKFILPFLALSLFLSFAARAADVTLKIRFGLKDKASTVWDGSVEVEGGAVDSVEGLRFAAEDAIDGNTWQAKTRPAPVKAPRSNNAAKANQLKKRAPVVILDNGVSVDLGGVAEDSRITLATVQGEVTFDLSDAPFGGVFKALRGAVEVRRLPRARALTSGGPDDDHPAIATGPDGTVYVAYVSFTPGLDRDERLLPLNGAPMDFSYLGRPAGGDRVWLRPGKNGAWGEPIPMTEPGRDVFGCAVAVDDEDVVWVIWSERRKERFDIWARARKNAEWGKPVRLTQNTGNDISPVAAVDGDGGVWVAWQSAREGRFGIFESHQQHDGKWSPARAVSAQGANCWQPSIAGDARPGGGIAIAWDTYEKGDYDVWMREYESGGAPAEARPVTETPNFEVNSSLAYDGQGRLWAGWETGGPMWAKDYGTDPRGDGLPLDLDRQVGLRVLEDGVWKLAPPGMRAALPTKGAVRAEFASPMGEKVRSAHTRPPETGGVFNKMGNLCADNEGRIWLTVRNRAGGQFADCVGRFWSSAACYFDGASWVGPIALPHSGDMSHKRTALVAAPGGGGILFAHPTDHRDIRKFECKPTFSLAFGGFPSGSDFEGARVDDVWDTDVYTGRIEPAGEAVSFALEPIEGEAGEETKGVSEKTLAERAAVARCRAYRIDYEGDELRLQRGEFHRHTEISTCSIVDGTLLDMWRYALDAASFDWIGNGDHDNGGGREYPWWMIQKMTDAYQIPGHFDPLFCYERSFNWPEGHRNVLFETRGVRTLPRLTKSDPDVFAPSPDTNMLYAYLRQFNGICAAHTSATSMGTDWRNNDPKVEPMVEIYQGCRQSYERPEAPRSPAPAIVQPFKKGFVNNALQKGYRLAFEASSDHYSTHISYSLVYAKEPSRHGIMEGMRARHVYGATDNIIADFRCRAGGKDYMLGDEFTTDEPPELRLKLIGTAPFAKVTLIVDDEEVKVWEPGEAEVEVAWTDPSPREGETSYYYFRGEQEDAELVWVSPMWIKYAP